MSSLAATQADGYYLPPEYHESGAKSKNEWHARQSGQPPKGKDSFSQKNVVRFELADPCVCLKCEARIGRGTRFNAVKMNTGESYYSTPIYEFHTKCRRCGDAEFVIRTDPKHRGFTYTGELRVQVRDWEAIDVNGLAVEQSDGSDNEDYAKKKKKSPVEALQEEKHAQRQAATDRDELEQLLKISQQTVGNDAAQNATIRQAFRKDRRERKQCQRQAARKGWKDSLTLMASSVADASEAASQVFGNAKAQQQKRWKKVREASIFGVGSRTKKAPPLPDPVGSATTTQQPPTRSPPRRKKRRLVIGTGGSISLGVMLSLMTLVLYFWEITNHRNETTSTFPLVASSPRYTVDMSRNDPDVRSLTQAVCRYLWAPSSIHGWGVFTTHDIARKTAGQPYPDLCFFIPRAFLPKNNDNVVVPVTALSGLIQEDNQFLLCQGFVSLMNHMPNNMVDRVRATSVLVPLGNLTSVRMTSDKPFSVTTFAQRKVKAGDELTTEYMGTVVKPVANNVIPEEDPIWLRQEGWCLDGMEVTAEGTAVAARPVSPGELLVASPVLSLQNVPSDHPVRAYSFIATKNGTDGSTNDLYFPYGPGLGFLSHGQTDVVLTPNVALRWYAPDVLHLYALRPIAHGDVLVLKDGNHLPLKFRGHTKSEMGKSQKMQKSRHEY